MGLPNEFKMAEKCERSNQITAQTTHARAIDAVTWPTTDLAQPNFMVPPFLHRYIMGR